MIPSQTSHDHTLVDQLSSTTTTQLAVAHTNESNIENKICNIKTKVSHLICNILRDSYKSTKAAVKYTYETMEDHSRITAAIFAVAVIVAAALAAYTSKLCITRGEINPIIALSTLTAGLVAALLAVAITACNYKTLNNRKASLPMIALSIVLIVAAVAISIVALVNQIAYVTVPSCRQWC